VLWSPVGAPAGVPGPRRNADDCDAGWFAPVATRRRPVFAALGGFALARSSCPGGRPPGAPDVRPGGLTSPPFASPGGHIRPPGGHIYPANAPGGHIPSCKRPRRPHPPCNGLTSPTTCKSPRRPHPCPAATFTLQTPPGGHIHPRRPHPRPAAASTLQRPDRPPLAKSPRRPHPARERPEIAHHLQEHRRPHPACKRLRRPHPPCKRPRRPHPARERPRWPRLPGKRPQWPLLSRSTLWQPRYQGPATLNPPPLPLCSGSDERLPPRAPGMAHSAGVSSWRACAMPGRVVTERWRGTEAGSGYLLEPL